ncbi:MAG: hypothetical protein K8J08_04865, partial [Thermoanaerobaculia bacterium]|nr:hypothetical protein [Thermoanaerobaculia bacterium]
PPTEPPETPARSKSASNDVVVIDPGGRPKDKDNYLADIAQAERNRRSMADASVIVVTDDNLAQHAEGGKLTFSNDPVVNEDRTEELYDSSDNRAEQEAYWRSRVRTKRQEWANKVNEIYELEQRASDLRIQFYDADDPFYRDTRIKPEWDRTLDNIVEARRAAHRLEQEVADVVAEGGRAGAYPGWLNDGTDLEPKERHYTADGSAPVPPDSVEPTMVEENP